jgi:hypothetical protein
MYCSKCEKEISDDSVFCNLCGSKIEKDSIPPINSNSPIKIEETEEEPPIAINNQTDLTPPLKTQYHRHDWKELYFNFSGMISRFIQRQIHFKNEYPGYGWVVLLLFYLYGIWKIIDKYSFIEDSFIIILLGFIVILPIYFWLRKYLIENFSWKGRIGYSSFLSGIISYILVFILVGVSIGWMGNYQNSQKLKIINEFLKSYEKQSENFQKQELEYIKMMVYEPKTKSEVNNKILKIDEYKIFIINKNENILSFINRSREINSKYKKDKLIDEQINKFEIMNNDYLKSSINYLDMYKQYLMTGDEKYYNIYEREIRKVQSTSVELIQLYKFIWKSL